jgi:CBS-domain-containing membrane protein
MLAGDLAEPYPTVRLSTAATDAARLLADRKLPGLIVVDDHDHPVAILPGSQLLRWIIPAYVQDDPALARVMDEESSDRLCEAIADRTVQDILSRKKSVLPVVLAEDTGIEIAAIMAKEHSPIVAVVEDRSPTATLIGAVSVAHLLEMLLPADDQQP